MSIEAVDTTLKHLIAFRKNVREINLKAFDDRMITTPFDCKTLIDTSDGAVLGVGGVDDHIVWLMCTKMVESRKVKFLKFSKTYYLNLLDKHGYLMNAVYIKNQMHIDYLNWLGVTWLNSTWLGEEGMLRGFIHDKGGNE